MAHCNLEMDDNCYGCPIRKETKKLNYEQRNRI